MIIRSIKEVEKTSFSVEWGNGISHRLLTEKDNMGFTLCHTIVRKGTVSCLEYLHHLEACYCIAGKGKLCDDAGTFYPIEPGVVYALDKHDKHWMYASDECDMILVSVFNPPLKGTETHNLAGGASSY